MIITPLVIFGLAATASRAKRGGFYRQTQNAITQYSIGNDKPYKNSPESNYISKHWWGI